LHRVALGFGIHASRIRTTAQNEAIRILRPRPFRGTCLCTPETYQVSHAPRLRRRTHHVKFLKVQSIQIAVPRRTGEKTMKDSVLPLLCCPKCRGPFKLSRAHKEGLDVVQGELACRGCGLAYRIVDGLPVILEKDVLSKRTRESFGREWTLHAQGRFEGNTVYGSQISARFAGNRTVELCTRRRWPPD
jgi:uncharacterized protein YbaR (Trm112 family)